MVTLGPSDVECTVLTFREGLLSPVGHDLKLRAESLTVELDGTAIQAAIDARALVVVAAMRGDEELPSALSASDREDIESRLQREILDVKKHPRIQFVATSVARDAGGAVVTGDLTVRGKTLRIALKFTEIQGSQHPEPVLGAEVAVRQTDLGMKPYRAMLGTLRVRDDVIVRVLVRKSAVAV